jgi:hypothetical protein
VSGVAVVAGVLAAYGAFALLISLVAAFANGAHSHQVLSGATWKQLGTGGGIVTGIVLFVAWAAGGFIAARMAGRDGLRHGLWVFIVGVVLMTVVSAAITWLPDTTAILRNLRLLGLPVRRNEWRDVATVAGIASLLGSACGAATGGWFALREPAPAVAPVPTPAPAPARPVPAPVPSAPAQAAPQPAPEPEFEEEPVFAGPSLFEETGFEPDRDEEPSEPAPVAEETPAWLQFIQERERSLQQEREHQPVAEPPPSSVSPAPAPWVADEPTPAFLTEPELPEPERPEPEPEPVEVMSLWPDSTDPGGAANDDDWALPDDEPTHASGEQIDRAFPPSPHVPVPEREPTFVPPLGEHADWQDDDDLYRAPPDTAGEDALQHAPEAPAADVDPDEREERRRQQEEAARAYEQLREDQ